MNKKSSTIDLKIMEAFSRIAPEWTHNAVHAMNFRCPHCDASSRETKRVWLNRYAPVTTENRIRKWQEFYLCECNQAWWGWSSDRINQ
jgi:hypothetical protein